MVLYMLPRNINIALSYGAKTIIYFDILNRLGVTHKRDGTDGQTDIVIAMPRIMTLCNRKVVCMQELTSDEEVISIVRHWFGQQPLSASIVFDCATVFRVVPNVATFRGVGRMVMGCQNTPSADRSTVKHALQNTQNDCYQWLSNISRMHQIRFRTPLGGAYSAPPDPLAGLRGLLLRGGEGKGRERGGEGG